METDLLWKKPKWRLLVFHQAMVMLGTALVICATVAGCYGQRVYFSFAASAAGVLLLARVWFLYCRWRDHRPDRPREMTIPYMLRRKKEKRRHKPAFLMDSRDFDDDLTAATVVSQEGFSLDQCRLAQLVSAILAGAMMILISIVIR